MKETTALRIGVTLGDPAGIGPEIIQSALGQLRPRFPYAEFVLFGSTEGVTPGCPNRESAERALKALEESASALKAGEIGGVVTGPVSKQGLQECGFAYPGQTEFFAGVAGMTADAVTMMMVAPRMTVALLTTHCPLADAIRRISVGRIERTVRHAAQVLRMLGNQRPRIAVAGLNPHAGEGGLFGREEMEILEPAIQGLRKSEGDVELGGPFSPDVVFRSCWDGHWDAVVALYHDQGLIPFKLVAFEEGVNVSGGLPFVRTSPDHGTAFDIAGKGQANPSSMMAAMELALALVRGKEAGRC